MLQSIRDKTSGWIASIVLGLVILTMAFFGLDRFLSPNIENYAARIEGPAKFLGFGKQVREISLDEFRERFNQARQMARQDQGDAFDAAAFEQVASKRQVLDQMIDEALIGLASDRDGLVVTDAAVQKEIMGIEAFQTNGKFSAEQYQLALKLQNMTPTRFQQLVRDDLLRRQLPEQLASSAFAGEKELESYLRLSQQTRDVRYLELALPANDGGTPTEAQIKAWYDSHGSDYRSEESVAVEYVELEAANLPVNVVADEDALRRRYEEEKSRFGSAEQRMASHILVKVDEKAPKAEVDAALAKAKDIAAKARAPGADFAALARQYSDDVGSKDSGGDLGPVSKGVFGDAFDAAFFALEPGQVSDPVRLPDGWHVIQFRELQAGNVKPFEEVRAQLEAEYLESERERVFNDRSGKLVDKVYANPNSLEPVAKELGLTIYRTGSFTRNQGEGVAALEPVRKAAFENAQKIDRQVSDPVEIEPNHVVVLHVIDYKPAALIPLAQVRDRVLADLSSDRMAKASKAQAEAMLERANKGESLDALATDAGRAVAEIPKMTRMAPNPQLAPLVTEAFSLPRPESGDREIGLVKFGPDRYALVEVKAVADGDTSTVTADTRASLRKQLAAARGAVDARAYIQSLRKGYTIKVAEDRL